VYKNYDFGTKKNRFYHPKAYVLACKSLAFELPKYNF